MILVLLALVLCVAAAVLAQRGDRAVALWWERHQRARWLKPVKKITKLAEGALWIGLAVLIWAAGWAAGSQSAAELGLALLVALLISAGALHTIKFLTGRARPAAFLRGDGTYGFKPFAFDVTRDSFPSGHAQTMFAVAGIAGIAEPLSLIAALPVAAALSFTRIMLTSHYPSDVIAGALLGAAGAVLAAGLWFPAIADPAAIAALGPIWLDAGGHSP